MARPPRPTKRIRVRSKRLDQLDETKLALALWLLAKESLASDEAATDERSQVTPATSGETGPAEAA